MIFSFVIGASFWGALPALVIKQSPPGFLLVAAWSFLGTLLLGSSLAGFSCDGFREDSLWTLAPREQAVVAGLAASLMLLGGWIAFRAARGMTAVRVGFRRRAGSLIGNLVLTLGCYFAVWFLSPQLFYIYYRLIFADLPLQWVIGASAQVDRFALALTLQPGSSLAATATGLYFWLLVSLTIFVHVTSWRLEQIRIGANRL